MVKAVGIICFYFLSYTDLKYIHKTLALKSIHYSNFIVIVTYQIRQCDIIPSIALLVAYILIAPRPQTLCLSNYLLVYAIFSFSLAAGCIGTRVYRECGSQCQLTCDNYQSPPFCSTDCIPTCVCPEGEVLRNGQCIAIETCFGKSQSTLCIS